MGLSQSTLFNVYKIKKMKKPSVLLIGATMAPLVKVGGLADVMESLPTALKKSNIKVAALIPYYETIKKTPGMRKKNESQFSLTFNGKVHHVTIHTYIKNGGVTIHLLEDQHFFKGKDVYPLGTVEHARIKKENRRFTFFAIAAASFVALMKEKPDVVHIHDWHTAPIPYLLKTLLEAPPKTLLTIHNLHFQGIFPRKNVEKLLGVSLPGKTKDVNFMKMGIEHADKINTVSPTYAKEILTAEYGEGLQGSLKKRKKDLYGIVNGINLNRFNPSVDKSLFKKYNAKTVTAGKSFNRKKLLAQYKMNDSGGPIFGMVSRIFDQKGFDIMNPLLPSIVKRGGMVIILGSGDKKYEKQLKQFNKKNKASAGITIGFDAKLAQQIYAASDYFLMPSKFEPCGLGQMIAMRYGTLPLVRATGGLKDTVKGKGLKSNGVVFTPYTKQGMQHSIDEAFSVYNKASEINRRIANAFKTDFSWDTSAKKYISIYSTLAKK